MRKENMQKARLDPTVLLPADRPAKYPPALLPVAVCPSAYPMPCGLGYRGIAEISNINTSSSRLHNIEL